MKTHFDPTAPGFQGFLSHAGIRHPIRLALVQGFICGLIFLAAGALLKRSLSTGVIYFAIVGAVVMTAASAYLNRSSVHRWEQRNHSEATPKGVEVSLIQSVEQR